MSVRGLLSGNLGGLLLAGNWITWIIWTVGSPGQLGSCRWITWITWITWTACGRHYRQWASGNQAEG
ncbi:hypothetical protein [Candidatus Darwinibacter acetoxidans]